MSVQSGTIGESRPRSQVAIHRPRRSPIPIGELEQRDIAAWRDLAARAVEPNPFFEPESLLPAARHLGEPDVGLLVVEDAGHDWLGCLPVIPRLRLRDVRVPVWSVWRHLHTPLCTPLVAQSAVESATGALVEQALHLSRVGIVALPWIGDEGPVAAGVLTALEASGACPAVHRSFERAIMRRPTLDDGVEAVVSRNTRRDLGRLGRRLAEQLDSPLELHDASERPAAVDEFIEIEATGWKGEQGTAFASQEGHADYFHELCDGFRAQGRLQLLALGSEDRAVSYKCNLLADDAVFCFKIAFDESFAHFRPGLQLELRMLELFRDGMSQSWMDSCADPDSSLFEHLWPERRQIGSYVLAVGSALGWIIGHSAPHLARGSGGS